MHWVRILIVVAALVAVYLARGLWLAPIGTFLVVEDPLRPAEAVVPLAGGWERILYASTLLRAGYADQLLITDMPLSKDHPDSSSFAELSKQDARDFGVPEDAITKVPGTASTTYGEAQNIRRLAETEGWRSLTVVTSPSHTRRSQILFQDAFRGSSVSFQMQASPSSYKPRRWWKTVDGRRETWSEYLKLLLYYLRYHHVFPDAP